MMKNDKMRHFYIKYTGLILCLIVFGLVLVCNGIGTVEGTDGETYIMMLPSVPPGYPIFLWMLREVFGDAFYLHAAVLVQSVLAAVAVWMCASFLKEEFGYSKKLSVIVYFVLLSPYFFTAFFSATHFFISNKILTEGIAISLWILFITFLLRYMYHDQKKDLIPASFLAIILSLIRGQLMICVLILAVVEGLHCFGKKKTAWLKCLLRVALSFAFVALFTRTYIYILYGEFMPGTRGGWNKVANVIYLGQEEDAELYSGEVKGLYRDIVELMHQTQYNVNYAEPGIMNRAKHLDVCHDRVKGDCVMAVLLPYTGEKGLYGIEAEREVDRISEQIRRPLLKAHLGEWIYDYIALVFCGLVRSVAVLTESVDLTALAAFLYLAAIVLLVVCLRWNKKSKAAWFMMITLLVIAANVTATSLVIMCLARYMIYNIPFFYIGGMLLLREVWGHVAEDKKK